VDDVPGILDSVRDLLQVDFPAPTAEDAEIALRMLEHEDVAVILSDQRMPGVNWGSIPKIGLRGKSCGFSGMPVVFKGGYANRSRLQRTSL